MKILSQTELKKVKDTEVSRTILRVETTRKALETAQGQLEQTETEFNIALKNQHLRWANDESEANKQIDILNGEIKALEEKRQTLLIPIGKIEDLANNKLNEATQRLKEAEEKKNYVDGLTELLEQRLTDVGDRSDYLDERESKIVKKELEQSERTTMINKLSKELDTKWKEYFKKIENVKQQ